MNMKKSTASEENRTLAMQHLMGAQSFVVITAIEDPEQMGVHYAYSSGGGVHEQAGLLRFAETKLAFVLKEMIEGANHGNE